MALSTGDRRQIYTRLAPVIGEQEAETLLDQFPTADTEPITLADLRAVEARLDHRIDLVEARLEARIDAVEQRLEAKIDAVEQRLDAKIDVLDAKVGAKIDAVEQRLEAKMAIGFERLEKVVHRQLRTQTILMITTIVAVLGLAARTNLFG